MSLEPKKPIEELLEASAQARRAEFGAEPTMPNPMRAQLQAEVARRNRAAVVPSRSWRDVLWPRLALASALAAVLVSAAVIWSKFQAPEQPTLQLAMNQPAPPMIEALKSDAAVPPTAGGNVAATGAATGNDALQKFADVAIAPVDHDSLGERASQVETEVQSSADERGRLAAKAKEESAKMAIAAAPPTEEMRAAPPAAAPALAKNERADGGNARQQFSQAAAGQALRNRVQSAARILNNFQVEQEGSRIRLVDEDGSTYSGKLEAVAQNSARGFKRSETKAAAPGVASMAPNRAQYSKPVPPASDEPAFHFRATGFNQRLKKQVVVEGRYITTPGPQQQAAKDPKQNQQTPARIVGTVQIPGESPVEVDAEAVVH